ncbi:MAG: flagellin [Phycisphaerales bacterium]|nr:flagellin [Phycisphaerales bacterium]
MSRITNNIPAVVSQRQLAVSQRDLSTSLQRLSSGLQINRGADDPAGLIVSERLRSEIAAVSQAIDNSERAINVIATTEGAINEVNNLLTDIQALVVEAANRGAFSDEEVDANQLQIDEAIEAISRIANTTTFAGRKLLDGSLDYVTSGIDYNSLANVQVVAANFGRADFVPVNVAVASAPLQAEVVYGAAALGASAVAIDLQGPKGIITLNFPANTTVNDMVDAINNQGEATGLEAEMVSATDPSQGMRILSSGYGSREFVSITTLEGSAALPLTDISGNNVANGSRIEGHDAVAFINGAATISDGLKLSLRNAQAKLDILLDPALGVGSTSFAITGGGSLFQLGPRVNTNQQLNVGVPAMQANKLGNRNIGFLSQLGSGQDYALKTGNFDHASDIVDAVITQVASLRGRLGAFERNNLRPNITQLQITSENLTSSESVIRDTDFAKETTELTRAQILVQAGTSVLSIANAQQQNVLSLLGG